MAKAISSHSTPKIVMTMVIVVIPVAPPLPVFNVLPLCASCLHQASDMKRTEVGL